MLLVRGCDEVRVNERTTKMVADTPRNGIGARPACKAGDAEAVVARAFRRLIVVWNLAQRCSSQRYQPAAHHTQS